MININQSGKKNLQNIINLASKFPNKFLKFQHGKVAQLVRASGSYPLGRGFKSLPCYHKQIHLGS